MNTDRLTDLERRAATHAALSEVARLRIVDLLRLGDMSPSELQADLGLPSNLLAHHLNVLEGAGLVVRHRSEADKRRSYVGLVPVAIDDLVLTSVGTADRVVFVCTSNSARSQIAAALWQQASPIPGASAGTRPADRIEPGAIQAGQRHEVRIPDGHPRRLDDVVTDHDFVITVCDHAHEEIGSMGRLHWSVPDPVPIGTEGAFDAAFADIARRVTDLAPRITPA